MQISAPLDDRNLAAAKGFALRLWRRALSTASSAAPRAFPS